MNGIQADDELALIYLNVALENNKFDDYLFSTPLFDLKVRDSYGNMVHSPKHVMTAIYTKQNEDTNINMGELMHNTICEALNKYQYHPTILKLLENIEYHVYMEKINKSNIQLDSSKLLDAIKNHLTKNQEIYKRANHTYGQFGMWPQLEMFDVRIQQSTGRKII